MKEQLYDRERRRGRGRACVVEYCGEIIPGRPSLSQPATFSEDSGRYTDIEEGEIIDIVLQSVMPPPPTAFNQDCSDRDSLPSVTGIVSEWGVEGVVPSHPVIDHIERIT